MFNFKKNVSTDQRQIELSIKGMHCTSCAMNIDDALEEVPGVISSRTNYARAKTTLHVQADAPVTTETLIGAIQEAGYQASVESENM